MDWQAIWLSVRLAASTTAILLALGLPIAYWLAFSPRRWKFLVVGASNEDDARELGEQIRREAPPEATINIEQSGMRLPFIPL